MSASAAKAALHGRCIVISRYIGSIDLRLSCSYVGALLTKKRRPLVVDPPPEVRALS